MKYYFLIKIINTNFFIIIKKIEMQNLFEFLIKKIKNPKFSEICIEISNLILEMY